MLEIVAALRMVYRCEPVAECLALVERACADGTLVEEDDGLFTVVAVLMYATADSEQAVLLADEILARAHRKGSQFGVLGVALWRGYALLRRGELADSTASFEEAVAELARWHGAAGGDVYAAAMLALGLLERGELEAARRALDPQLRGRFWTSLEAARWWNGSECEVLLAAGEYERVLEVAEELRTDHPHVTNVTVHSWRSPLARALHALGRTAEALPIAEENLALARRWGAPSAVGRTLRELGELKGEAGLPELEASVAALEGSTARLELAKSLAVLGRTLRHARRPGDAREPLRRALELADACGAAGLAEDVRAELYAAGARPRTAALTGAGALTASERRVAALAAEGSSNRDIAQALFVTPKTVEVHLSNAYRKLGIRSRRELAGALVEA